jgi:hypothetical protein
MKLKIYEIEHYPYRGYKFMKHYSTIFAKNKKEAVKELRGMYNLRRIILNIKRV